MFFPTQNKRSPHTYAQIKESNKTMENQLKQNFETEIKTSKPMKMDSQLRAMILKEAEQEMHINVNDAQIAQEKYESCIKLKEVRIYNDYLRTHKERVLKSHAEEMKSIAEASKDNYQRLRFSEE